MLSLLNLQRHKADYMGLQNIWQSAIPEVFLQIRMVTVHLKDMFSTNHSLCDKLVN